MIKFKKGNDGLVAVKFFMAKDGTITTNPEGEKVPYDLSQVQSLKAMLIRGFDSKKIQTIAKPDGDNGILIEVSKDLDHGKYSVEVSFDIPANSLEDKLQTRTFRVSGFEIVRSDDKTEDAVATMEYVDVQAHTHTKTSQEIITELSASLQTALEAQRKLNEDKARIESELEQAKQNLEQAQADDEADEAEKERLAGQVKGLEAELETTKRSAEELTQTLNETRTTLEQVNAENTAGKARIAQLEAELTTSNSDKERLTGELTQAQEALNKALADDTTDKAEIQRLTDEVNTITANLQTATERAETLTQELEAAREEVRTKTAKVEELTASIAEAENRKRELEAELTQAQKDLEQAQADDEADEAEIERLTGRVSQLTTELETAKSSAEELSRSLDETRTTLERVRGENEISKAKIAQLRAELEAEKSKNKILQDELDLKNKLLEQDGGADLKNELEKLKSFVEGVGKDGIIDTSIPTRVLPRQITYSHIKEVNLPNVDTIWEYSITGDGITKISLQKLKRISDEEISCKSLRELNIPSIDSLQHVEAGAFHYIGSGFYPVKVRIGEALFDSILGFNIESVKKYFISQDDFDTTDEDGYERIFYITDGTRWLKITKEGVEQIEEPA